MTDIYFLFGRFHFGTAIASKPFFLPLSLLVHDFPFFFLILVFSFFLSVLYSEQLSAGVRNCGRLSEIIFQKGCILSRRKERDGLFCIMIPPTVYFLSSVIVAM